MAPPMNGTQKTLALLERRKRVAESYLRGQTQWEIARAEKVDQKQISRDLAKIRDEWKARYAAVYDERVAEQCAKIDRIEAEAWAGWERSQKDEETLKAETIRGRVSKDGDALPDMQKSSKSARGQAGDEGFLSRVAWCIEMRLKLIGALKNVHEHSGPGGGPIPIEVKEIVCRSRSEAVDLLSRLGSASGVPGRN